jgi:hypothetical protein
MSRPVVPEEPRSSGKMSDMNDGLRRLFRDLPSPPKGDAD